LLEEILDRFHIVIGGALYFLDLLGILYREIVRYRL